MIGSGTLSYLGVLLLKGPGCLTEWLTSVSQSLPCSERTTLGVLSQDTLGPDMFFCMFVILKPRATSLVGVSGLSGSFLTLQKRPWFRVLCILWSVSLSFHSNYVWVYCDIYTHIPMCRHEEAIGGCLLFSSVRLYLIPLRLKLDVSANSGIPNMPHPTL